MIKAMMMMMMEDSFVFLSWSNDDSDDLCRIRLAERLHLRLFIHRIHIHINHTGSITPTLVIPSTSIVYSGAEEDNSGLVGMPLCVIMSKILMLFVCSTGSAADTSVELFSNWR